MIISKSGRTTVTTAAQTLLDGGVVIMPCDTIYGIVGIAPDSEAQIKSVKGREESNPFLRLIGSVEDLKTYSDTQPSTEILDFWPGPLTLVVHDREGGTVAVRVPDDPYLQQVLAIVRRPVFSTSVNTSGSAPLSAIGEIIEHFENRVDLIVDGGVLPTGTPSTIVDVTRRPYRVLRQGSLVVPKEILDISPR